MFFFNSYEGGNKLKLNITLLFEIHTVGTTLIPYVGGGRSPITLRIR